MIVSPLAIRPARTNEADALKSVAIVSAPERGVFPLTMALSPKTSMLAPRRRSSFMWENLLSKMVSVMMDVPLAWVNKTINCACMSVGKPG